MLYFVYLPSKYREHVLSTVTELGIPIIDIHKEVFVPHTDPLSLFPFRKNNHYNAEGYQFIAEVIEDRLKKDGMNPLNLKD